MIPLGIQHLAALPLGGLAAEELVDGADVVVLQAEKAIWLDSEELGELGVGGGPVHLQLPRPVEEGVIVDSDEADRIGLGGKEPLDGGLPGHNYPRLETAPGRGWS